MCIYIHTYIHIHMYVCVYIYADAYMHAFTYTHRDIPVFHVSHTYTAGIDVHICAYICVCMCVVFVWYVFRLLCVTYIVSVVRAGSVPI